MNTTRLPLVIALSGIAVGTLALGVTAAVLMNLTPPTPSSTQAPPAPAVDPAPPAPRGDAPTRSEAEPESPSPAAPDVAKNPSDEITQRLPHDSRALLISATYAEKREIVQAILRDPEAIGEWRHQPDAVKTLILVAIERGNMPMLQDFLDAGAEPGWSFDWTTEARAGRGSVHLNPCSPLSLAAHMGQLECLQLMIQHGADPWPETGPVPAIEAVRANRREVLAHLLSISSAPPWADLLRAAVEADQPRMVDQLVRAGAPLAMPEGERSLIAIAIEKRRAFALDRLLHHRALVTREDLFAARRTGDEAIMAAFRKYGHAIDTPTG